MLPVFRSALLLLITCMSGAACAAGGLPLAELDIKTHRISVEVANTPDTQQAGLMHRKALAQNQGMVFVNPDSEIRCMWMKNTLIPLSVAFIDEQGRILGIEDMQPHTRDHHCSKAPAQFALEMNLGWFGQNNIKPGDTVRGLDRLPAWRPY
jgi:uncharacterized membrane protein (UPF0127 family)